MNVKEYIESGILEAYALGQVSDQERQEVQCLTSIYPELKEELESVQQNLDEYAKAHAQKAPSDLKAKILAQVRETEQLPVMEAVKEKAIDKTQEERLDAGRGQNRNKSLVYWSVAASFLFILGLGLSYWQFNESEKLADQVEEQSLKLEGALEKLEKRENQLAKVDRRLNALTGSDYKRIPLKGTEKFNSSYAEIHWNKDAESVFINVSGLPTPPEGKQYQLWALDGDQPISKGMIESEDAGTIQEMLATAKADAFAITLEKEGGVEKPTLEQMVVLGKVS
ncbi:anti-sigma factor [Salibacter halophilus]|uniref:anti-sigma factor n=1 Tax=Salibacter halophilus TaxID=1803916 RepID=UPI0014787D03|nr:anti-sigma factor [Salibacter halophilus]